MAGKTSRKNMISRRVANLKDSIAVDTQKMRGKTLKKLEDLFDLAVSLAKGEVKTQTEEGRENPVTLKQRQMWARVAAYIAQIMNSVASGFDERQIDADLDELERLVNEAKAKAKSKKTKRKAKRTRRA